MSCLSCCGKTNTSASLLFGGQVTAGAAAFCIAGGSYLIAQRSKDGTANQTKLSSQSQALAFAGFATPEAAFKSLLSLENSGDVDKFLAACTPEQAERLKKKMAGLSRDELKRKMSQDAHDRSNYEIADNEEISDAEVRLHLTVEPYPGHPNVGNDVQVMQKIGNDWKYAGKYGVDIKEQNSSQ